MERAKLSVLQTSMYKSVTELTSQYNKLRTNGKDFRPSHTSSKGGVQHGGLGVSKFYPAEALLQSSDQTLQTCGINFLLLPIPEVYCVLLA